MAGKNRSKLSETTNISQLTGCIGAELTGFELDRLDKFDAAFIYKALLKHQVVFFRDQNFSPSSLVSFAKRFGQLETPHAGLRRLPRHPNLILVETKGGIGSAKYSEIWHSDGSFNFTPPKITVMQAIKLPNVGGDTLFASMYSAYNSLSKPIKKIIHKMEAFHDGVNAFRASFIDPDTKRAAVDGEDKLKRMQSDYPGAIHPVVIQHSETGRKALYVNRLFTTRILGLSDVESRNLLNLLFEHAEQSTFQVRWRWTKGDVVMWDNRCTMHFAAMDYGKKHRIMHRATIRD